MNTDTIPAVCTGRCECPAYAAPQTVVQAATEIVTKADHRTEAQSSLDAFGLPRGYRTFV